MSGRPGRGRAGYSHRPSLAASSTRHEGPAVFPPADTGNRQEGRPPAPYICFASLGFSSLCFALLCSSGHGFAFPSLLSSAVLAPALLCFASDCFAFVCLLCLSWQCFPFPRATLLRFLLPCSALPFLTMLCFAFLIPDFRSFSGRVLFCFALLCLHSLTLF